ncbi:MAG: RcnB family protein [Alphaproteobacteria bacterium]|nr:RcnB family protein [Alphaproteobacteria bacterium]
MRLIAKSLLAGALVFTAVAPALAEPKRYEHSRGHNDRGRDNDRRHDDRRYDDRRNDHRYDDRRWEDRRGPDARYDYSERDAYRDGRHDSHHRWRAGDRFDHRTRYVVVRDYDRYRVAPPRRGHYYAQTDTGELLLIAAATGLVVWALNS